MANNVDIKDFSLDERAQLLSLLVNGARKGQIGELVQKVNPHPSDGSYLDAVKKGYIDYFHGSPIKMDLTKDSVYSYLYERDVISGKGSVQRFVDRIRSYRA
jgi:hypothetical protein